MNLPKVLVILGSTASGKSSLAVKLTKRFGGEIISADSRQVYKGLDIGTGKITKKEMDGVCHYLLDVANPKTTFTVAKYQKLANLAIKKILRKKKLPIICGGTGLYIDSLIYDLKFPKVKPQKGLREKLEKLSTEKLFNKLKRLDPERAKNIDSHNPRRLIRALEIALTTGKPIPSLISAYVKTSADKRAVPSEAISVGGNKRITNFDVLKIGLNPPKETLRLKIKKRLKVRLKNGLVIEVKKLKKQLGGEKLDNFGLEYRYVNQYLDGVMTYEEMKAKLLTEIWRYAKRQMTWFKRDKEIKWIKNQKEVENLVKNFLI